MENNKIIKNYFYNMIYQLLVLILPIITIPYTSRVLGAENIGVYSYTLSIVTYFVLLGNLGMTTYGRREIAYNNEDVYERTKTFFEINILRLLLLSFMAITYIVSFCFTNQYIVYFKLLIFELIGSFFDISWFYQGLELFKKTSIRNCLVKILSVLLIFLFVKSKNDLWIYILIYCLSNLLGNITLWLGIKKYLTKINAKELNYKKVILASIGLFIPQLAVQIYTMVDKTMLGSILSDKSITGYYDQEEKIVKIFITIITSLGIVLQPSMAKNRNNSKKIDKYVDISFKYVLFISLPMIFGIISVSDSFIPIFLGEGYNQVIYIIYTLSPIMIFIGLSGITGPAYLIPLKKTGVYTKSVLIGACTNVILNMLLISKFKAIGAAIATVLSEFIVLIIQLYEVNKDVDVFKILYDCKKYFLSSVIMCTTINLIRLFKIDGTTLLLCQVIMGILIYLICLFYFKDEFIKKIFKIISTFREKVKNEKN